MRRWFIALTFACGLSCGEDEEDQATLRSGVDETALDRSVAPCDDFYQFACGRWLRDHPVHPDAARSARFADPFYDAAPKLRAIVEDASPTAADGEERLIAQYRDACNAAPMQTATRAEVQSRVDAIRTIHTLEELAHQIGAQRALGSGTFFGIGVEIDPGDSSRSIVVLYPGGVELPDPSYYLDADQEAVRSQYRAHIRSLSRLILGVPLDEEIVVRIETALARAMPPPRTYDPLQFYHPMSAAELEALAPSFPWAAFWAAEGLAEPEVVDVSVPEYFVALDALFASAPVEELSIYAAWQLVQDRAKVLDQEVTDRDFEFWRFLSGRSEPLARDWLCYLDLLNLFEPILARKYVEKHFDENTLGATQALSTELATAFGARIREASWLDSTTRAEALDKLDRIRFQIGHPHDWESYLDLDFERLSFFDIYSAVIHRFHQRDRARLGVPVDPDAFPPPTLRLNAFFNFNTNAVIVGGLMLAPPFLDLRASKASQLGALGAIIGHELTHGFDDAGRRYDGSGTLRDWWTPETEAGFAERSECLVQQFDAYEPLPGQHVDGLLTLGENIADLGGISIAHRALVDGDGATQVIPGFDPEEVLFIAYAQVWCESERPEFTSSRLIEDPHSPERYRVNGALGNLPQFGEAFGCAESAPMLRADACQVW